MTFKASDFKWVDIDEAATIPKVFCVEMIHDNWWITNGKNQIAFYKGRYAQCNSNREIAERFHYIPGATGTIFITVVYRKHRCEDYV